MDMQVSPLLLFRKLVANRVGMQGLQLNTFLCTCDRVADLSFPAAAESLGVQRQRGTRRTIPAGKTIFRHGVFQHFEAEVRFLISAHHIRALAPQE
jgi:hypothetical protein